MSIRNQLSYNSSLDKSVAYIDLVSIIDFDPEGLVTESLVFSDITTI